MTELESYLETIEPELRVMTRLFGFPEEVWDEPKRFVPRAEETEGNYHDGNNISGNKSGFGFGFDS